MARIKQVESKNVGLHNQLKEKDDEIRALKNDQKNKMRDKTANKAQVEQKLVRAECDLKKTKLQLTKLQDQLTRQMGINSGGTYTAHGLEVTERILDYNGEVPGSVDNSTAVKEYKQMLSTGLKKELSYLKEENRILKQNLLTFQDLINKAIEDSLKPLQQVLRNKDMLNQYNQMVKQYRITNTISSMQFNIPQTPATTMYILNVFKENIKKFRQYTQGILNPSTIAELVQQHGCIDATKMNINQKPSAQYSSAA